jgi:antitoxin component YwqK of YwqJK toxin-antitoxin module
MVTKYLLPFLVVTLCIGCDLSQTRKEFYSNGKIKSEAKWKNGVKNGESVLYDSVGNVLSRQNFANDTLQGKSITYHVSGNVFLIENYDRGVLNGEFLKFYENGYVGGKGRYKNGKGVGVYYQYHPIDSGTVSREAYLMNVKGESMQYYVKRITPEGDSVDEYRSIGIIHPKTVSINDTITVEFRPTKESKYDSVLVIVGDFDDEFNFRLPPDTIRITKNQDKAYYKFLGRKEGTTLLRGEVITYFSKVFPDHTDTTVIGGYFEELITVKGR